MAYIYTIRSETRNISGLNIGRYSFAFKESYSTKLAKESPAMYHAENAKSQNKNVRHFIVADSFSEAARDEYAVFEIASEPNAKIYDAMLPKAVKIGTLVKRAGRFVVIRD